MEEFDNKVYTLKEVNTELDRIHSLWGAIGWNKNNPDKVKASRNNWNKNNRTKYTREYRKRKDNE
tara:strand:+ start:191 stop:385 length:195 start_codon:yes stop_codon:yes gene_type:complete